MEQDKGYLMLPRGVQHMRALGSFGRLTIFVHHLSHHPMTLAVVPLCWCLGCFVWFGFSCLFCRVLVPVLQVSWNFSNPPRVLDLDDRQGLIASSAMQ